MSFPRSILLTVSVFTGALIGGAVGLERTEQKHRALLETLRTDTFRAAREVELLLNMQILAAERLRAALNPESLAPHSFDALVAGLKHTADLHVFAVADQRGVFVFDPRRGAPAAGIDISEHTFFRAVRAAPRETIVVGAAIRDETDGSLLLPVALPIRDDAGAFRGAVVAAGGRDFFAPMALRFSDSPASIYLRAVTGGPALRLAHPAGAGDLSPDVTDARPDWQQGDGPIVPVDMADVTAFAYPAAADRIEVFATRDSAQIAAEARHAGWHAGLCAGVLSTTVLSAMLGLAWSERRARRAAAQATRMEEQLRLATAAANIGIWDYDVRTGWLDWNPQMHALFDLPETAFDHTVRMWIDRLHPEDRDRAQIAFAEALAAGPEFRHQFRIQLSNGTTRTIFALGAVHRDALGAATRVVGVNLDRTEVVSREAALITAHRTAEAARQQVLFDSLHDPLTKLGNRRGLTAWLDTLSKQLPATTPVAVLHIDLDRFKTINDVFGHAAGDHLLEQVARTLNRNIRKSDFSARLGGDEFAIVLVDPQAEFAAETVAERIIEACRAPISFGAKEMRFGCSIGICTGTVDSVGDLVARADLALYEAKNGGRNRSAVFTPELQKMVTHKKRLADELVRALADDEIGLRFQPQLAARTGALHGVEALMRWMHPKLGELPPAYFLPVAEEQGLIEDIDALLLGKAVSAAHRMEANGHGLPRMSVNVSRRRLLQPNLLDTVAALDPLPCPIAFEPRRVCRRLQLLSRMEHHEQDHEQVFP